MTIKHQYLAISPAKKLALAIVMSWTLSACSTTANDSKTTAVLTNQITPEVSQAMSVEQLVQCQQNADNIEQHAQSQASSAQYLNAAKTLRYCLIDLPPTFAENGDKQQIVMKMMASATLNFIKAGDVVSAKEMVKSFKSQHPKHDLYFNDYTSFLDTAMALLTTESLSAGQLSSLNISRALRYEIERKHYWLSH